MQLVWEDNWNKWKPIWCHVIKGIIKHKPEKNKVRGKGLLFPHFCLLACQNLRKKVPLCGKILLCTTEGPTKLLLLEGRRLPTYVVCSLTQGEWQYLRGLVHHSAVMDILNFQELRSHFCWKWWLDLTIKPHDGQKNEIKTKTVDHKHGTGKSPRTNLL